MASTYSTSLKLELIGNGEQSGTWGTTTNKNLGTLLEQAITGVTSIVMVNANYTLSNINGATDEARNAVIVVGGTNSAIRQVIAPLVNKLYTVSNQTAGGYAITFGGTTGSVVTVPNGVTALCYCDGTNFYAGSTGSVGDYTVAGNFYTNGNATFTGVPSGPTAAPGTNTTQLATTAFVTAATGTLGSMSTQNANAVNITGGTMSGMTSIADTLGAVRSVPIENKTTSYTLQASDNGQCVSITTGGVTVPSGVLSAGQVVTIYNNSGSSQTITQGSGATLTFAAVGTTGNRTLAAYGLCTVICIASNSFVIAGSGVA